MNKGLFDLSVFESCNNDDVFDLKLNTDDTVVESTSITASDYQTAMATLEKTFRESAELIKTMQSIKIVENTNWMESLSFDDIQEINACEMMLEAYRSDAYLESVSVRNKEKIKGMVNDILSNMPAAANDRYNLVPYHNFSTTSPDAPIKGLTGNIVGMLIVGWGVLIQKTLGTFLTKAIANALRKNKNIRNYLWQMVGNVPAHGNSESTLNKYYNDKYKEFLDDGYELKLVELEFNWWARNLFGLGVVPSIIGNGKQYIVIIDEIDKDVNNLTVDVEKPEGFDDAVDKLKKNDK